MLIGNQLDIPIFLKAKTPELLVKAMASNNVNNHMEYFYFDIQFVKGSWYVWFKKNLRNEITERDIV